jgi:hypothetical protein
MMAAAQALLAVSVPALGNDAGGGWWRAVLGMVAVFALLVICLRLLRRWPGVGGHGAAGVEAVWPLGPRREIHVVRLDDEVHYVYRNDQGLVMLRSESLDTYRAAADRRPASGGSGALQRWFGAIRHRCDALRAGVTGPAAPETVDHGRS